MSMMTSSFKQQQNTYQNCTTPSKPCGADSNNNITTQFPMKIGDDNDVGNNNNNNKSLCVTRTSIESSQYHYPHHHQERAERQKTTAGDYFSSKLSSTSTCWKSLVDQQNRVVARIQKQRHSFRSQAVHPSAGGSGSAKRKKNSNHQNNRPVEKKDENCSNNNINKKNNMKKQQPSSNLKNETNCTSIKTAAAVEAVAVAAIKEMSESEYTSPTVMMGEFSMTEDLSSSTDDEEEAPSSGAAAAAASVEQTEATNLSPPTRSSSLPPSTPLQEKQVFQQQKQQEIQRRHNHLHQSNAILTQLIQELSKVSASNHDLDIINRSPVPKRRQYVTQQKVTRRKDLTLQELTSFLRHINHCEQQQKDKQQKTTMAVNEELSSSLNCNHYNIDWNQVYEEPHVNEEQNENKKELFPIGSASGRSRQETTTEQEDGDEEDEVMSLSDVFLPQSRRNSSVLSTSNNLLYNHHSSSINNNNINHSSMRVLSGGGAECFMTASPSAGGDDWNATTTSMGFSTGELNQSLNFGFLAPPLSLPSSPVSVSKKQKTAKATLKQFQQQHHQSKGKHDTKDDDEEDDGYSLNMEICSCVSDLTWDEHERLTLEGDEEVDEEEIVEEIIEIEYEEILEEEVVEEEVIVEEEEEEVVSSPTAVAASQ